MAVPSPSPRGGPAFLETLQRDLASVLASLQEVSDTPAVLRAVRDSLLACRNAARALDLPLVEEAAQRAAREADRGNPRTALRFLLGFVRQTTGVGPLFRPIVVVDPHRATRLDPTHSPWPLVVHRHAEALHGLAGMSLAAAVAADDETLQRLLMGGRFRQGGRAPLLCWPADPPGPRTGEALGLLAQGGPLRLLESPPTLERLLACVGRLSCGGPPGAPLPVLSQGTALRRVESVLAALDHPPLVFEDPGALRAFLAMHDPPLVVLGPREEPPTADEVCRSLRWLAGDRRFRIVRVVAEPGQRRAAWHAGADLVLGLDERPADMRLAIRSTVRLATGPGVDLENLGAWPFPGFLRQLAGGMRRAERRGEVLAVATCRVAAFGAGPEPRVDTVPAALDALGRAVRASDLVGMADGRTFLVAMWGCRPDEAAARLAEAGEAFADACPPSRLAIGVAGAPPHPLQGLLAPADRASLRALARGGRQVVLAPPWAPRLAEAFRPRRIRRREPAPNPGPGEPGSPAGGDRGARSP